MPIYDSDIRASLVKKLSNLDEYRTDPSTVIVSELDVCAGNARIDIAVMNHKIVGYEIKSERDTLERLPSQIEFYNKFSDEITLVVSEQHYSKAKELIPDWWGIECATPKSETSIVLSSERKPKQNEEVDVFSLTQLLWKMNH